MRILLLLSLAAGSSQEPPPKAAPPAASELDAAKKIIRKGFKEDYASRSPDVLKRLAERLKAEGLRTKNPAETFAFLDEARDVAARSGEVDLAMGLIDAIVERFTVDEARLLDAGANPRTFDPATAGLFREHTSLGRVPCSVAFSPDGRWVAVGSAEDAVRVLSASTWKEARRYDFPGGRLAQVAFSGDGRILLAYDANRRAVHLFKVADGTAAGSCDNVVDTLYAFAPGPDAGLFVVSKETGLWVCEIPSGREVRRLSEGPPATAIFRSRDGKRVAAVQKSVKIYDVAGGQETLTLAEGAPLTVAAAFSPKGDRLVAADVAGTARIWDVEGGRELHALRGPRKQVDAVAWSADGRWITTASRDGALRFWDAARGVEIRKLEAHREIIYSAAFCPDGRSLVTTGNDGKLNLWAARAR